MDRLVKKFVMGGYGGRLFLRKNIYWVYGYVS